MTQHGNIRPIRPEDWPAVDDIIRRIWSIGLACLRERTYDRLIGGKPWQEHKTAEVRQELFAEPANSFVTEVDGRVLAFCCLHVDTATGIGEIGHNGVHPDVRGQGYGPRQIEFILDELRRRGMSTAEVQTALNDGHAPARKMYERAGFKPIIGFQRYYLQL
ncbi:MAG: GNAT family N-acetyltransferase [Phycisphaerae bacterium]|nr:GNAT family N-acetyltransferase [Phycisphaerae bacterium]